MTMIKRILKSKSLQEALRRAIDIAENPEQLASMSQQVKSKLGAIDLSQRGMNTFLEKIKILLRMIRAYVSGDYRDIPWRTLLLIVATLLYFLMPLDLIPDFIPGAGYIDDLSLVLFVFNSIGSDIAAFQAYELAGDPKTGRPVDHPDI